MAPRALREVQAQVAQEDWTAAHRTIDEAVEKRPGNERLQAGQRFVTAAHEGHDALGEWQLERALAAFERAEAQVPLVPYVAGQRRHAASLLQAWTEMESEDWSAAMDAVEKAHRALPSSAQAPVLRAQLQAVGRAEAALDDERWGEADRIYADLADPPVADFAHTQRRALVPLRLGVAHLDREAWAVAEQTCEQARAIKDVPQARRCAEHALAMERADADLAAFAWEDALEALERADQLRRGADYVAVRRELAEPMAQAERHIASERYDDALTALGRAVPRLQVVQRRTAYAQAMSAGQSAARAQRWDLARAGYRRALSVERSDRVATAQVAYVDAMKAAAAHIRRRRWSDAQARLEQALVQRPGDALADRQRRFTVEVQLALGQEAAFQWKPALETYQRAEQLMPGDPFVAERQQRVRDNAVDGALAAAFTSAREARFERAFAELGFARDNDAPTDRLAGTRDKVVELMRRTLSSHVARSEFEPGFELVLLGTRELGSGVPWIEDARRSLRTLRVDQAWGFAERGEYQRGLDWLDPLDRFEPERAGEIGEERRRMRRTWARAVTDRGLARRDYPGALGELAGILGEDPRLADDRARLERELRETWAGDVRAAADEQLRLRHPGAAAALTARAVEIAGLDRDRIELDRLRGALRDEAWLPVSLEVRGEPWRAQPLFRDLQHALRRGTVGVAPVAPEQRPSVTIRLDAEAHRCTEATEAVTGDLVDAAGTVVGSYPIRRVTRTCAADLALAVEGAAYLAPVRVTGKAETTDDASDALPEHGLEADPLAFELDDPALVTRADAESLPGLVDAMIKGIDEQWRRVCTDRMRALSRTPDQALGELIGVRLLRPDLLSRDQLRELDRVMSQRYGLEDPSVLLRP